MEGRAKYEQRGTSKPLRVRAIYRTNLVGVLKSDVKVDRMRDLVHGTLCVGSSGGGDGGGSDSDDGGSLVSCSLRGPTSLSSRLLAKHGHDSPH